MSSDSNEGENTINSEEVEEESSIFSCQNDESSQNSRNVQEISDSFSDSESPSSSSNVESVENSSDEEQKSFPKRNKIEDNIAPAPVSTPFGTKIVFGSAAKNIVSFNSLSSTSGLPAKSLFAEDASVKPVFSEEKSDLSEHDVITGEEDENTIISMKGKLFEFNPESKDWHERGIGIFKLNKSKKSDKYRIIMRTDGVQKLVLNSNLFPKMICEVVQDKNIRFSANNFESKIQTFILRLKHSDDANALEKSLKEAIDTLKSTEGNC